MIIAKKEAMGDGCPDFGGDTFLDAKKKMVEEESSPGSAHMQEMQEIATKLHECADRLHEMTGESGENSENSKDSEDPKNSKDDSYGESVEY